MKPKNVQVPETRDVRLKFQLCSIYGSMKAAWYPFENEHPWELHPSLQPSSPSFIRARLLYFHIFLHGVDPCAFVASGWMFQTREMRKKRGEKNIGEKWTKRKWSLNPLLAAGYHPSSRSSPDKRPDEFHCPPIWVEIEFTWHVKTTLFFVFMQSWHWMIKRGETTLISQRKK